MYNLASIQSSTSVFRSYLKPRHLQGWRHFTYTDPSCQFLDDPSSLYWLKYKFHYNIIVSTKGIAWEFGNRMRNRFRDFRVYKLLITLMPPHSTVHINKLYTDDLNPTRCHVKGLWPSNAIWRHEYGSTLSQIMDCCLTHHSNYLNPCWLIMGFLWHTPNICCLGSAEDINS